jgi:hypothetical protein
MSAPRLRKRANARILANSATKSQPRKSDFVGTLIHKQFFHERFGAFENIFSLRGLPQPQRKPEVRANRFEVIDNLLKQLAETPLTQVLAGVKSATRLKLLLWCTCDFGREISDIQNKFAVRFGSSLRLKTT